MSASPSRRACLPIAALAVACTLPACGTSAAGTATAPLEASFLHRLEAVCAADYTGLVTTVKEPFPYPNFDVEHPDPALLPKVGTFFAPNVAIWRRLPTQLAGLGSPRQNADEWTRLRQLVAQNSANGIRQVRAAGARQRAAFISTAHTSHRLFGRIAAVEDALGVPRGSRCRDTL